MDNVIKKTKESKNKNNNSYKYPICYSDDLAIICDQSMLNTVIEETKILYKEIGLEINIGKC